jgi:hypothetical protein
MRATMQTNSSTCCARDGRCGCKAQDSNTLAAMCSPTLGMWSDKGCGARRALGGGMEGRKDREWAGWQGREPVGTGMGMDGEGKGRERRTCGGAHPPTTRPLLPGRTIKVATHTPESEGGRTQSSPTRTAMRQGNVAGTPSESLARGPPHTHTRTTPRRGRMPRVPAWAG